MNTNNNIPEQKHCLYCVENSAVDWQDVQTLQRFFSHYARIVPRRRTGLCAKHQRAVARAIKRARIMGLMPFVKV
ncbi:MAG: 30S ribosomal protein S18 [Patescibacteria group bacterium]